MQQPGQGARVPVRPVMLYDGECRFCELWIRRWRQWSGDAVEFVPFQDDRVALLYPELPRERLETAVHLIETNGAVCQGAEAVFLVMATKPAGRWTIRLYRRFQWMGRTAEWCYRFVAGHRSLFSWLTRLAWGGHIERPNYFLVRRAFLTLLGAIYLVAFVSLWAQVPGLIGSNGILPARDLMSQAASALAAQGIGIDRYRLLPTLCWFGASDLWLHLQCAAGATLAVLAIGGIAPRLSFALMWVLYLSLATVCREFLGFQWDNLLLETGLVAVFFAPPRLLPRPSREKQPPRTTLWLLRLLLFKLMFLSGVVKLSSKDEAWRSLTALTRHYETQPLPTWIGWYAHQLPLWFQKASCVAMFGIELGAPFLIFAPRRVRMTAGALLAGLQVLILLTGNYTFFNWLTLALCLLLLDDFALARLLPAKLAAIYSPPTPPAVPQQHPVPRWRLVATALFATVIASVSAVQLLSPLGALPSWMSPAVSVYYWVSPFRSVNSYGLFAVMTLERPEIIVEGSNDGRDWREYDFPCKPGDPKRRPAFVAPHQPRLDWQMWFAALGSYRQNPWFVNFCTRLLQGSPDVLALLAKNPFPDRPPRYIRARLYQYQFTTSRERRLAGAWWKRQFRGEYLPPISLELPREQQEIPHTGSSRS